MSGGRCMAIRVAELARAGLNPDWMPGAVWRSVPVEVIRNEKGEHATPVVVGIERGLSRGTWRAVELLACPDTWCRPRVRSTAHAGRITTCARRWARSARRCSPATCSGSSR